MREKRGSPRDSLFLLATLRIASDASMQRARIRNLSASGLMAECAVRAMPGERVDLELRNLGWVSGIVAWVSDNRFGIAFDHEVDVATVRQRSPPPEPPVDCVRRPLAISIEPPPPPDPARLRAI